MAIDFPTSPTVGQQVTSGSRTWSWSGSHWTNNTITGVQGIQGIQGVQGIQGTQGTQGLQGIQGISGASILGLNNTFTGVNSININGTVGATTPSTVAATSATFNGTISHTSAAAYSPQFIQFNSTNDTSAPYHIFQKIRGSSIVQAGDTLGTVLFQGYDGTAYDNAAYIAGRVAAVTGSIVSGELLFVVTDSSGSTSTRAIITSTGLNSTAIGATTPSTGAFTTLTASGNTGIGTASPSAKLEVSVGDASSVLALSRTGAAPTSLQLNFGSARPNIVYSDGAVLTISDLATDTAQKDLRLGLGHYTNSEEPMGLIFGASGPTANVLYIGGGTALFNAATEIGLYAAANNTTATGTQVANFTTTKLGVLQTTASTSTTTGALTVAGGLGVAGATYIGGALSATGAISAPAGIVGAYTAGTMVRFGGSGGDYSSTGYNFTTTSTSNVYNYSVTDSASLIQYYNGGFKFLGAASGTAGAAITLVERAALTSTGLAVTGTLSSTTGANFATSSGSVGIGTASPGKLLEVNKNLATNTVGSGEVLRLIGDDGNNVSRVTEIGFGTGPTGGVYSPVLIGAVVTSATGYNTKDLYFATRSGTADSVATERMRITSTGNVGIGVTPSAWSSSFVGLQIGGSTSIWTDKTAGLRTFFGTNYYFDGTNRRYLATGAASDYLQATDGAHIWYNVASGAAGTTISFTERMRIDSSGHLVYGSYYNSIEYSITLGIAATQWVKLCGINNPGQVVIKGHCGSNNSEEAWEINVRESYTTTKTVISCNRQSYNPHIQEVRVEGSDGSERIVYIKIRADSYAPTVSWRLLDCRAAPAIYNTNTTPAAALYASITVSGEKVHSTNEDITTTGAATFGTSSTSTTPITNDLHGSSGAGGGAFWRWYTNSLQRFSIGTTNGLGGVGTDALFYGQSGVGFYFYPNGALALSVSSSGVAVAGALSKGSGSFRIEHPLPSKSATHQLVHSFIEGPKCDLIYRGKVDLVDGKASVNIDTDSTMTEGTFEALCTTVQCFTSNESGWGAIRGKVTGNILTIEAQDSTSTDNVSWMVIGERKDKHILDTDWTDSNGRPIVEPLKPVEAALEATL